MEDAGFLSVAMRFPLWAARADSQASIRGRSPAFNLHSWRGERAMMRHEQRSAKLPTLRQIKVAQRPVACRWMLVSQPSESRPPGPPMARFVKRVVKPEHLTQKHHLPIPHNRFVSSSPASRAGVTIITTTAPPTPPTQVARLSVERSRQQPTSAFRAAINGVRCQAMSYERGQACLHSLIWSRSITTHCRSVQIDVPISR